MIVNKIIIVMLVQLAHGVAAFPNHGGFPSRPHNKLAGRKKNKHASKQMPRFTRACTHSLRNAIDLFNNDHHSTHTTYIQFLATIVFTFLPSNHIARIKIFIQKINLQSAVISTIASSKCSKNVSNSSQSKTRRNSEI